MRFILRVAIHAVAIWVATLIVSGLSVVGEEGSDTWKRLAVFAGVGLIFGLLSTVIKPLLKLLSLPLIFLTLGLFTIVINGVVIWLVGWISEQTDWGLRVENFGTALLAAIIVSLATFGLNVMTLGAGKR